jgi:hypothetical protein
MFDDDQDSENPFLKTRGESARRFYFSNETHRFKLCPVSMAQVKIVKVKWLSLEKNIQTIQEMLLNKIVMSFSKSVLSSKFFLFLISNIRIN